MKHQFHDSTTCGCDRTGHCVICDGGLADCRVCGLAEGTLTTDCPGEFSWQKHDEVYAGRLDFVEGQGWVQKQSPHSPGGLKLLARETTP